MQGVNHVLVDSQHIRHCLANFEKKAVRNLACFVLSPSTNLRAGDKVETLEASTAR